MIQPKRVELLHRLESGKHPLIRVNRVRQAALAVAHQRHCFAASNFRALEVGAERVSQCVKVGPPPSVIDEYDLRCRKVLLEYSHRRQQRRERFVRGCAVPWQERAQLRGQVEIQRNESCLAVLGRSGPQCNLRLLAVEAEVPQFDSRQFAPANAGHHRDEINDPAQAGDREQAFDFRIRQRATLIFRRDAVRVVQLLDGLQRVVLQAPALLHPVEQRTHRRETFIQGLVGLLLRCTPRLKRVGRNVLCVLPTALARNTKNAGLQLSDVPLIAADADPRGAKIVQMLCQRLLGRVASDLRRNHLQTLLLCIANDGLQLLDGNLLVERVQGHLDESAVAIQTVTASIHARGYGLSVPLPLGFENVDSHSMTPR